MNSREASTSNSGFWSPRVAVAREGDVVRVRCLYGVVAWELQPLGSVGRCPQLRERQPVSRVLEGRVGECLRGVST